MSADNQEYDEDMLDDMEGLIDDDDMESLFWSLAIPNKEAVEIPPPMLPGYIVRVTKACFGATVSKGSRTVVVVNHNEDPESAEFVPICVLKEGTCENVDLDLVFNAQCEFKVEGTKASQVFLTGYIQPGDALLGDNADLDEDDYLNPENMEGLEGSDIEDVDDDVAPELIDENTKEEEPEPEPVVQQPPQKKRKLNDKKAKAVENKNENNKNNKNENNNNNKKNNKAKKSPKQKPAQTPNNNNNKKNGAASPAAAAATAESKTPANKDNKKKANKKKKMSGGLEYKDIREGNGNGIKKGDKVSAYYIGQTANDNKIFDKTLNGNGFEFTVGKGQVIKGWDMGVLGMKGVGSKRKLWIPANLAYGSEAQTGIPANSKLLFTIEIKKVVSK